MKDIQNKPICFSPAFLPQLSNDLIVGSSRLIYGALGNDFIFNGSRDSKKIAITFDDGPSANFEIMPALLKVLKKYNVKVTFFVLGERLSGEAGKIARQAVREGHELQIHAWNQKKSFREMSSSLIEFEIKNTIKAIKQIYLLENIIPPKKWYLRPPWGLTTPRTTKVIQKLGINIVITDTMYANHNLETNQFYEPTSFVVKNLLKDLKSGLIVTLHASEDDGSGEPTLDSPCAATSMKYALPQIISRGYEAVTLSELMSPDNKKEKFE